MKKELLNNATEFDIFVKTHTGDHKDGHGNVISDLLKPEKYPCVLIWQIVVDNDFYDYIDGEYVYLDDFKNN